MGTAQFLNIYLYGAFLSPAILYRFCILTCALTSGEFPDISVRFCRRQLEKYSLWENLSKSSNTEDGAALAAYVTGLKNE